VAKAVSTAFNMSSSGGVTLPNGVTPEVAVAISRAHAEALVQLTERLATIQLLRDGLHRACEAYANGAISDTTYAVMLSRFDKMMVTMLVSELAAGAFGRSLAAAGAGSEGSASAAADLADKVTKARQAEATLKGAEAQRDAAAAQVEAAKDAAAKTVAQQNLERTKKDVENADRDYKNSLKAEASSAAKIATITAAGGVTSSHNPEIVKTLAEIQRKYIENLNFDALEVGCISALDRGRDEANMRAQAVVYGKAASQYGLWLANASETAPRMDGDTTTAVSALAMAPDNPRPAAAMATTAAQSASMTPFAAYCMSDVLPIIQAKKGALLNAIVSRAEGLKDADIKRAASRDEMQKSLREVEDYVATATKVLEQLKSLKAIAMP